VSLTLHMHPLASYCQKVLIALYEHGTPFTSHFVDLGDEAALARFKALWPMGKMPVLRDDARDRAVAESSIIIEYLDRHYPGANHLIPADPELALEARFGDRFFDIYVHDPMQRIVGDRLRPPGKNDPFGVEQARATLSTAYAMLEQALETRSWAAGDSFTIADCAAGPSLFFANKVEPFTVAHPRLAAYFAKLADRPSFARALREAEPYLKYFPQ